ncbi:MAG TPA: helix-turn-helix transcriptional regulator [Hyphomicrobiaceae bacterium]
MAAIGSEVQMSFSHATFAKWNGGIAKLLESESNGVSLLEQAIHDVIDFDILMIFKYTANHAECLHHNIADARSKIVIDDYLKGPFVLDPFYSHALMERKSSFGAMRDLSPDHFHKSEFYRQHYHLTNIADEIGIFFGLDPAVTAVLSITREKSQRLFSRAEKTLFAAMAPVIETLGRKIWQSDRRARPDALESRMESAFAEFGKRVLSRREMEVATLILRGHSSLSIGNILDISAGTVKIHRKNIYAKLNISSQAELFHRFLQLFPS